MSVISPTKFAILVNDLETGASAKGTDYNYLPIIVPYGAHGKTNIATRTRLQKQVNKVIEWMEKNGFRNQR